MADDNIQLFERSEDPQVLMKAAVQFASSSDPMDLNRLSRALQSDQFLDRLDSQDEYLAPPRQLRLARVIYGLIENASPSAHQVLVQLIHSDAFLALDQRQLLLIQALVVIRPPPDDAISFWHKNSQADSPYVTVTICALADNGSTNALALLERKMADTSIEADLKVSWMRRSILVYRHEVPMLETCGRMLTGSLPEGLRASLVEALFDYQLGWYQTNPPDPPPFSAMSQQARGLLRGLGDTALKSIYLGPALKAKVELTISRIS